MRFLIPITLTLSLAAAFTIDSNVKLHKKFHKFRTTAKRVAAYGYEVTEHDVRTKDDYILKLFRITNNPKRNCPISGKPVVLLQHGILSSSDCWILNGPNDALAYLLADRCYDVWMGNARGNTYSKQNAIITTSVPLFWDFSWNEIGLYDLPAMIDYMLHKTGQRKLHYVGHSQGTTAFMVMLSQIPSYNDKIKSSYMLAPVGYMNHMKSPLAKVVAPILGYPNLLQLLIGNTEFMPNNKLLSRLGAKACADKSIFQRICRNILFLIAGWNSQHLNYTLLPEVMETHPAGASTKQFLHYLQEYNSGHYRKFDRGLLNIFYYGSFSPPDYQLQNIRQEVPIQFFYSDNDYFAAVVDVKRMAYELGKNVELNHIPYREWNHLDFLFALDVKEVINDKVIARIDAYEKKYQKTDIWSVFRKILKQL